MDNNVLNVSTTNQFLNLFNSMQLGVVYQDAQGVITLANPAAERILALSLKELQGRKLTDPIWQTIQEDGLHLSDEQHPSMVALQTGKTISDIILGIYDQIRKKACWLKVTSVPEFLPGEEKPYQVCTHLLDITEQKQVDHKLNERMKELHAFYTMTEITEKEELTLDSLYQRIIEVLPKSWQYPEITCGRIVINGEEFKTDNFRDTEWKQSASIKANTTISGSIEINYLAERPQEDEGPFLKEERLLLNSIAERIGRITERKQAVKLLQQKNEFLELVMLATELGSWRQDFQTKCIIMDERARRHFGFSGSDIDAQDILERIHPADIERVLNESQVVKENKDGSSIKTEYRVLHPDGTIKWLLVNTIVKFAETDSGWIPVSATGTSQDITERKQVEEALHRKTRSLYVLSNCNQALVKISDEMELLQEICRICVEDGDYRMAWVGYVEHNPEKTIRPVAQYGFEEGYLESANITWDDSERGRGPTGTAVRTQRPCIIQNIQLDPRLAPWREAAIQRGYASSIGLPLSVDGNCIGVITLYARDPDSFKPDEVNLLTELTSDLSYGIDTLRTRADHAHLEDELHRSNTNYRLISENSTDVIWVMNAETEKFSFVSPSIEKLSGFTPEEMMQMSLQEVLTPETLEKANGVMAEILPQFLQGKPTSIPTLELEENCKDGLTVPIEVSITLAYDGAGKVQIIGITRDITERKKNMELLLKAQNSLENAQFIAHMGSWELDPKTGIGFWSKEMFRLFQYDSSQGVPMFSEFFSRIHPEDRKALLETQDWVIKTGKSASNIYRAYPTPDEERFYETSFQPVVDTDGHLLYLAGTVFDITQDFQMQEKLRQSNETTKAIFNATLESVILVDTDGIILEINKMGAERLGGTPAEVTGKCLFDLIPPEVASFRASKIKEIIRSGAPAYFEDERTERRYQHNWYPIFDSNEKVKYIVIYARDITEAYQAQEALRKSEETNRTILNATLDSVLMVKPDGEILVVNEQGARRFDLDSAELIGKNFYSLLSPEEAQRRQIDVRTVIKNRKPVDFESERDGHWFINSIYPIFDSEGQVAHIALYGREITTIKLAAKSILESEERLKQAQKIAHLGSWELDIQKNVLSWSDEIYRIFGLKPQEFKATYEAFLDSIHPGDRQGVAKAYSDSLTNRKPYEITHRLLMKDGTIKYVFEQCETTFADDGTPLYSFGTVQDITERKKAEEALLASEKRNKTLVDAIPDLLFRIKRDGTFVDYKAQSSSILYAPPEAFMGKKVEDVLPPQVACQTMTAIQQAFEQDMLQSFEYNLPLFGKIFTFEARTVANLEADEAVVIVRDVTEQKKMENDLRESEEEYRQLVAELEERVKERTAEVQDLYDNAPTGYHSLDVNGRFRMINQTELNWLGYTREEVIGKMKLTDVLTPESAHYFKEQFALFLKQGKVNDLEFDYVRKDGSILPVILSATTVYDKEGNFVSSRTTIFDNTERKKAQEALMMSERSLRKSRDALSAANAALEKASKLKDEFLASMSHELRTPLTGVLGLAEALQLETYGPLNEKQQKALENIESSGRHLLELINDILDLSKIGADKLELQFETCSVSEICQASLQMIKGVAQQKRLKVGFSMNVASANVRADPRRFKQMLVNLLSNSVKFTPESGSLGLDVDGSEEEQMIKITVWDKGIGIKSEDMSRLFKPFVQLDSSLAREHSGTGLGLSLVAKLAELHGGCVSVESTPGEGSRFTIMLPWLVEEISRVHEVKGKPIKIRRCLFIEDNDLHRLQIGDYLQRLEIECIFHKQGGGALEAAVKVKPDVILLDLNLPDKPGSEVLEELKNDPRTSKIVVIISSVREERRQYLDLGAAGYLVKPFTLEDMKAELAKITLPDNEKEDHQDVVPSTATILLADDNEVILGTVTDFLRSKSINVITARNGRELVDLVPEVVPDLILADIQMPGMDGLTAMREIRAFVDPTLAKIPIIAMTALAMPGDEEMCLQAGASSYISKPVSLKKLFDLIQKLISVS